MNRRRVVVTGMGVLVPNGQTVDEFWKACISGTSGIGCIKTFDIKDFDVKIAGEVKDFDDAQYPLPGVHRKIVGIHIA